RGVTLVIALAVLAVLLNVLGPRALGEGTDLIFQGFVGSRLPDGVTKEQAVEQLRAGGQGTFADMVAGMDVTPGQGVDFDALRWVLLGVLALYLGAALFSWLQAYLLNIVVQRTMLRLRSDVEDKIHRLPLSYFDRNARGDLLSR